MILEDTLKSAIRLKLESEISGIKDRMRNLSLLLETEWDENRFQCEPPGQRGAEENDGRTVVDLLKELCTVSLELKEID